MAKKLEVNGLEIFLLPSKTIFIPKYNLLVISDWHLGKLGHFRQEGLFVPPMQLQEEFVRFASLLDDYIVKKVIFLGDLFHSSYNYEWDEFTAFLKGYATIDFILTKGNHDLLPIEILQKSTIHLREYVLLEEGIVLSHEPIPALDAHLFNIVGHIHPGCEIMLPGRQFIRLPCFYQSDNVLTMPAFGKWTGLFKITKTKTSKIYAIVNQDVIEV